MKWLALLALLVRERSARLAAERAAAEAAVIAEAHRRAFDLLQRYHVQRMTEAQDQIEALRRRVRG
jgi:hypothetical protein